MRLQNINTYNTNLNQLSFKSCVKYKQEPEKLSQNAVQLINQVHDCNDSLISKGYNPLYFLEI